VKIVLRREGNHGDVGLVHSRGLCVRLAASQNIVAVAEMSNGDLYTVKREVKVTIGGCGG
jgi:predicted secreted protein